MRTRYKITDKNGIYFITNTIVEWIPVFISKNYFNIIIDTLKFCQNEKDLKLYAYVILENHFHLIVAGQNLSNIMKSLKSYTSKQILELLKNERKDWILNQFAYYKKRHKIQSNFQLWQEGFHPKLINSNESFNKTAQYIHYNPVRRGYIEIAEHWTYSSARNYVLDDDSIIQIDKL